MVERQSRTKGTLSCAFMRSSLPKAVRGSCLTVGTSPNLTDTPSVWAMLRWEVIVTLNSEIDAGAPTDSAAAKGLFWVGDVRRS
jgi:hypothetical protein